VPAVFAAIHGRDKKAMPAGTTLATEGS
jgi:hypothetical protein